MASCATSVPPTPEWKVFTAPDRDERIFQESSLVLYFLFTSDNSCELFESIVDMWFTGEDFEDEHYGKHFFKEMKQMMFGNPGGWKRPPRICQNAKLVKQVNQWILRKEDEYGIPHLKILSEKDIPIVKESILTLPDELKPVNIIYKIRKLPGWNKMDSPEMHKEVVYFMTHLTRTEYGCRLRRMCVDLFDLDQYMPWHVANERICNSMSVQDQMGFFNYCVKIYNKKKRSKNTSVSGSTVSIVDSIMGSTESVV